MKRTQKLIIGIGTTIGLSIAALTVSAHPGQMGAGTGHGTQGGSHQITPGGMGHGATGHGGMRRDGTGPQAAQQLMTPEERTALQEKMRSAKTPEERQQIVAATRAEMEQRAKDKGITLPEQRGPRGQHGAGPAAVTTPPATSGHVH